MAQSPALTMDSGFRRNDEESEAATTPDIERTGQTIVVDGGQILPESLEAVNA